MRSIDIVAILAFIVIALTALNLLGDPRFKEGFENWESAPFGANERSNLSPEVTFGEREPAHLLHEEIETTRPFNVTGTLTQQQCYEQDGTHVTSKVSDYSQRTNNYKRTYPDSCSAPFKELVGSFYAPRNGAIGTPIPVGARVPPSLQQAGKC
jgi:hypothetical protein